MRIVFRTDASRSIGHGHVVRCLTLAEALTRRGARVVFVCREHDGDLGELVEERGFRLLRLPRLQAPAAEPATPPPHAAWLGTTWEHDAEQTAAALAADGGNPREPADWLIVDHYALDRRWETRLRSSARRIMVIDDPADRPHDCDLLLDQNLVAAMETRYDERVPASAARLLGPEFALLQPLYADLHDRTAPRRGPVRRLLISFGGVDADNLTALSLAAFLDLGRADVTVDVVVGAGHQHADALRRQAAAHDNVRVHGRQPTLAPLMATADLAIGAAGATSWERLCLGLPSLVVALADNQRPIARELDQRRLIRWLGDRGAVDRVTISGALEPILDRGLDGRWSRRCRSVVDGRGASRVAAALTLTGIGGGDGGDGATLTARRVAAGDEKLLLAWANDPATRANAFSSDPIPAAAHHEWLSQRLRDPEDCRFFIIEGEGVAVGQVRFQRQGDAWEVHYSLAPLFRGRRLGGPLLQTALDRLAGERPGARVFGQVKSDNRPSRRIFERLGFADEPAVEGDRRVFRKTLGASRESELSR